MREKAIVIGLGETGYPLYSILKDAYPGLPGLDMDSTEGVIPSEVEVMNICFGCPDQGKFISDVKLYQERFKPELTIIHSTVPVGTTAEIENAVHSPILGMHRNMRQDILTYTKWVGGEKASEAAKFLNHARIMTHTVEKSQETELMKLMCLAKYGMAIAFSIYQKELCDKYEINYEDVYLWDTNYNYGVLPSLKRPVITPPSNNKIGGHCVVPGSKILNSQFPNQILEEVIKHG